MMVPEGDVDILARAMIKNFPTDAVDQAALRSNAFFVLGNLETSERWLLVSDEIQKIIQAGQAAGHDGETHLIDTVAPEKSCPTPPPPTTQGKRGDAATKGDIRHMSDNCIPILIAMVAWSEVIWLIALRT